MWYGSHFSLDAWSTSANFTVHIPLAMWSVAHDGTGSQAKSPWINDDKRAGRAASLAASNVYGRREQARDLMSVTECHDGMKVAKEERGWALFFKSVHPLSHFVLRADRRQEGVEIGVIELVCHVCFLSNAPQKSALFVLLSVTVVVLIRCDQSSNPAERNIFWIVVKLSLQKVCAIGCTVHEVR